jgi:hypothetical protein
MRGVPPACFLKLEAANAHSTNSSAGKRRHSGTRSASQNRKNCLMVPEYRLKVESARLLWIAWLTWCLVCLESKEELLSTLKKECGYGRDPGG